MADVALEWNGDIWQSDLRLQGSDLARGDDLLTAAIISLFTWRRANDDDELPDTETSRLGWWGDSIANVEGDRIGSRLWLLRREKLTAETINRALEYCREALAWMVEDGVAARVDVSASRTGLDRLDITVTVHRGNGEARKLAFANAWAAILQG